MYPRVKAVAPNANYTIRLTFTNGEVRVFDVKPYLDKGIFRELQELRYFNSAKVVLGSVQWQNGQDFCPDMLYMDSAPYSDAVNMDMFEQQTTAPQLSTILGGLAPEHKSA